MGWREEVLTLAADQSPCFVCFSKLFPTFFLFDLQSNELIQSCSYMFISWWSFACYGILKDSKFCVASLDCNTAITLTKSVGAVRLYQQQFHKKKGFQSRNSLQYFFEIHQLYCKWRRKKAEFMEMAIKINDKKTKK